MVGIAARPIKVGLTGAHGTGKSTLLSAFEKHGGLAIRTIPEVPRLVIERAGAGPAFLQRDQNNLLRQGLIIAGQLEEESLAMLEDVAVVLSDRTVADHWAYTEELVDSSRDDMVAVKLWRGLVDRWLLTYDLVVRLPPEFVMLADGVREEDEAFRHRIDERIQAHLSSLGVPFATVGGAVDERVAGLAALIGGRLNGR